MKFTNKHNLPDTILRAAKVQNAKYDRGNVHRSVTQLLQAPRIDVLRRVHFTEMEKDISDEWWALFGSAVHAILEMGKGPDDLVEHRMFTNIDGWEVSGACDLIAFNRIKTIASLRDYKVTTAFVLMKDDDGAKPEWTQQLNMLAYLVHLSLGVMVNDVAVVCIVRDWQRTLAENDPLYPKAPVVPVKLPLWPLKQQEAFMIARVAEHRNAEMLHDLGQTLPYCTDEDRWAREHSWAVIRDGGAKAAKVFYEEALAEEDAKKRNTKVPKNRQPYVIQYRPGKSVRCEGNYCQVSPWCEQWAAIRAAEAPADDGPAET